VTSWRIVLLEQLIRPSASQEIPRILCKQKVHYHTHKRRPPVPILRQINPIHTSSHFLKIRFNITLPSMPWSYKWPFPLTSPHQNAVCNLFSPVLATCTAHLIPVDLITRITFGELYRSLSFQLCNFLLYPVTSSHLGPNVLISTLFSNTLSLRSSLDVSDQVPHSYKTRKIIVIHILIFIVLDSKLEDKRFCTK
jgi:hypothetical protein